MKNGLFNKKNRAIILGLLLTATFTFTGCSSSKDDQSQNTTTVEVDQKEVEAAKKAEENASTSFAAEKNQEDLPKESSQEEEFNGYRSIEVDGGNQSGHREANVVVNIGFGNRKYYAFTNKYGQLVKVTAKRIILQDDSTEEVNSKGRYYPDEAKVPGVESPTLDEGHVIADSLGGVSNAYNITPQESTLNRHGDQAYMEKIIRGAGGCTDFTAIITYPNSTTQIPSHYSYTYTLDGDVINDEFDNVNPDKVNAAMQQKTNNEAPVQSQAVITSDGVKIVSLDKRAEYVIIKNTSSQAVNLAGWKILSVRGRQSFTFSSYTLNSGATVKVGDSNRNSDVDFHWLDGRGTWNNVESDPAELIDPNGKIVSTFGS